MLAALFLNSGFLFAAAALVSVPIIIHLINRMRFKRVRWAAMEFLIKAQKRTRRRLIIEQLLLLAMRCLLIALVGLLVSRFVGCSDTNVAGKTNLHIVLLDDTLSMQDQWEQGDKYRTCFDVAKENIIIDKIAKGMSISKTNDKLIILPLSKLNDPDPVVHDQLNSTDRLAQLRKVIENLRPTALHVPPIDAIKKAEKLIAEHPESAATLHFVGDFRQVDWSGSYAEPLHKEILDLVKKHSEVKVRLVDTVHPPRPADVQAHAASRDNVGIIDVRPSTRIAGKKMPVIFNVAIKNFSTAKEFKVNLDVYDEATGKQLFDVDFDPPNPISIKPDSVNYVNFERRFNPDIKPNESYFANLSVRLAGVSTAAKPDKDAPKPPDGEKKPEEVKKAEGEGDALPLDNIRYTAVEVREKVPILVIDGAGAMGRQTKKDSFHIERSLISVPGASYEVIFGDELLGVTATSTRALERPDLNRYPTIFLLNVAKLEPGQLTNLENYVKDGGSLAFFLGKDVDVEFYNKHLYKNGKGVFPAPLLGYNEKELEPKSDNSYHLLVREEKFPKDNVPIFGPIFKGDIQQREALRDLPIRHYFSVDRAKWKQEPGKVFELATLPNDAELRSYAERTNKIVTGPLATDILANEEFKPFHARLRKYFAEIDETVDPSKSMKTYDLAGKIDSLLNDKGNPSAKPPIPSMPQFWASNDDKVRLLRDALTGLREDVQYGDPFIVLGQFGKGRIVAVMSTAGRDWNDWGGASNAAILYTPFIMEMQQYLSGQGSDANLSVGTNVEIPLNTTQFQNFQLKMVRYFVKPEHERPAQKKLIDEQTVTVDGNLVNFQLTKNLEPGLYLSEVFAEKGGNKLPVASYAHVFNVDSLREGPLQRAKTEDIHNDLISKSNGAVGGIYDLNSTQESLVGKQNDFSESPWLFLIFLLLLVMEQALAVHLSFHLRNTEDLTPTARSEAKVA